jgi:nucleoside 2-deoxyribosyltransferase
MSAPQSLRIFLSHRDAYRVEVAALAAELRQFLLQTFVAHEDIEGGAPWRAALQRELTQMDALVAIVTDDFHSGGWTDQEVGFAVATNKPIIGVRIGQETPKGFLADVQAVRGTFAPPRKLACAVAKALALHLPMEANSKAALMNAFAEANTWADAHERFDRLEAITTSLSTVEIDFLVKAFRENGQISHCKALVYSMHGSRFSSFLTRFSGRQFLTPELGKLVVPE